MKVGVFVHAVLLNPDVSLPTKYALVATDHLTMPQALAAWARVRDVTAALGTASLEAFTDLWGIFGHEIGLQFRMHNKEASFTKGYEQDFITMEDLHISEGSLIGHEETLKKYEDLLL